MDYKDKIRKLLALAKSPEPEEAKLALLKARKLMAEHKLTREHWRTAQGRAAESYKDRFGKCIGEKCMAYENGRCKRLEREGAQ